MKTHTLFREQLVRSPVASVFEFFAQARNLETITPPWRVGGQSLEQQRELALR